MYNKRMDSLLKRMSNKEVYDNSNQNLYIYSKSVAIKDYETLRNLSLCSLGDCNRELFIKESITHYSNDNILTLADFLTVLSLTTTTKELIYYITTYCRTEKQISELLDDIVKYRPVVFSDFTIEQLELLSLDSLFFLNTKFDREEKALLELISERLQQEELTTPRLYLTRYYMPKTIENRMELFKHIFKQKGITYMSESTHYLNYKRKIPQVYNNSNFKYLINDNYLGVNDIDNHYLTEEEENIIANIDSKQLLDNLIFFKDRNDMAKDLLIGFGLVPPITNLFIYSHNPSELFENYYKMDIFSNKIKKDFVLGELNFDLEIDTVLLYNIKILEEIFEKNIIHKNVYSRLHEITGRMVASQYKLIGDKLIENLNNSNIKIEPYHLSELKEFEMFDKEKFISQLKDFSYPVNSNPTIIQS